MVAPFACAAMAAEPPRISPIKGVVLLRNGEVLSGTIARTGDYYHVSKPAAEIRLKASEVDKVAETVTGLYEEKRRRMTPGKLPEHLDLAEWCIEQRLLEQANTELAAAAALEPNHPRIVLLQRRIELAGRTNQAVNPTPPVVDTGPSSEELDRLVRGLPAHAVETFTSSIQPLLVNNCTTSGCHGPRSPGKLRLLRLSLSGPANRRLTQRNLHAVWQMIDVNQPAASPLLTQPIRPHGKAKGPIFSGHEAAQYRQLVSWVYSATRQRRLQQADEDVQEPSADSPAVDNTVASLPPDKKKKKSKRQEPPAALPVEASLDEPPTTGEPEENEPSMPPSGAASDQDAARDPTQALDDDDEDYEPVDPFDPEVFNRRFFRR
ncbi:MAG: hypothetical protein ACREHD_15630 [Pirellulales bacterium]